MTRTKRAAPAMVGVSDHAGWAILMTVARDGALLDRRRVELVDDGLPCMPHHHDGQKLPIDEAVALVERVRASAERCARTRLDELAAQLEIGGIALRACPPLPDTVAERIRNYRAMCVADWVMYRQALADAAASRRWTVHWYDGKRVLAEAPADVLGQARAGFGAPWQKDHKMAMAAALAATRGGGAR